MIPALTGSSQVSVDDQKGSPRARPVKRALFERLPGQGMPMAERLVTPEQAEATLSHFKKSLSGSVLGTDLKAAAHGSSGYTLLGRGPAQAFGPAGADDQQMGIVLKWIPHKAAKDERACNDLAEAFGLDVPVMQSVPERASTLFVSPTKKEKPSFTPGPFELIAMNRVEGMNLSQLCCSGDIFRLKQTSWNQMMREFGKAAMFDIFSGNFDRFARFEMNADGTYALVQKPEANPGNVMVHTTPQKGNLSSISFIDNTSLAPPSIPEIVQEESYFDGSLFESEPAAAPASPARSPSRQSENPAVVRGLNAFFIEMTEQLKRNPRILSEHISLAVENAILRAINEESGGHTPQQITEIRSSLRESHKDLNEGLIQGLDRLRSAEFQRSAREIAARGSRSLQELLHLNLQSLQ